MRKLLTVLLLFLTFTSATAVQQLKHEPSGRSKESRPQPPQPQLETPPDMSGKSLHERVADFVVRHNPELRKLRDGLGLLKNIRFDVSGKYTQHIGENHGFAMNENDRLRWEVMLNLTLFDRRAIRDQELLYIQTERKIRQEVIELVDQYLHTQREIERAKKMLEFWNNYLAWTEKRVQAGVEYARTYYDMAIKSATVEKKTDPSKSLTYIVAMICSYVDSDSCFEIKRMLGADKIGPDNSNLIKEVPIDKDIPED